MHTNHVNICKFDDEEDENYKVVRGEIKKLIAASSEAPKDKVYLSTKGNGEVQNEHANNVAGW